MIGLIVIAIIVMIALAMYADRVRRINSYRLLPNTPKLLRENVAFYNSLDEKGKLQFEARIKYFLAHTTIRGIDVEVEGLDSLLIASGAIMLIFSFPDWKYNNISEVLLYKDTFSRDFQTQGKARDVLGMVGDGAMQREMILSKPALRASFLRPNDGHNTAIHEFAHLVDKADGYVDGIPEYLLPKPEVQPWVDLIRQTINEMKDKGHSDIDMYAATSESEFFAVVSEYFFERPEQLKDHHPELFSFLNDMFRPPVAAKTGTDEAPV